MAKIKLIFFLFCVFLNAQNRDTDIQRIDELKKLGDSLFKVSIYTEYKKTHTDSYDLTNRYTDVSDGIETATISTGLRYRF